MGELGPRELDAEFRVEAGESVLSHASEAGVADDLRGEDLHRRRAGFEVKHTFATAFSAALPGQQRPV
jgi:hypothetical protein